MKKRTIPAQVQPVVILPCPFCKGRAGFDIEKKLDGSTSYTVVCRTCGNRTATYSKKEGWTMPKEEAGRRWNFRAI